jgi:hypothetical protein
MNNRIQKMESDISMLVEKTRLSEPTVISPEINRHPPAGVVWSFKAQIVRLDQLLPESVIKVLN